MDVNHEDRPVRVHINNVSVKSARAVPHQLPGKKRLPVFLVKLVLVDGTKRYMPLGWNANEAFKTATEALNEA